jgi:hypothetical protein
LAAVLTHEPEWSGLPAAVPRGARSVLERCLVKHVRRRLRDGGTGKGDRQEGRPLEAEARAVLDGSDWKSAVAALHVVMDEMTGPGKISVERQGASALIACRQTPDEWYASVHALFEAARARRVRIEERPIETGEFRTGAPNRLLIAPSTRTSRW